MLWIDLFNHSHAKALLHLKSLLDHNQTDCLYDPCHSQTDWLFVQSLLWLGFAIIHQFNSHHHCQSSWLFAHESIVVIKLINHLSWLCDYHCYWLLQWFPEHIVVIKLVNCSSQSCNYCHYVSFWLFACINTVAFKLIDHLFWSWNYHHFQLFWSLVDSVWALSCAHTPFLLMCDPYILLEDILSMEANAGGPNFEVWDW